MRKLLLTAVLLIAACGGDNNAAPAACEALASDWADMCARCDVATWEECYVMVAHSEYGTCQDADQIRDEYLLYNVCLPWIWSVSCATVASPEFQLDSSCEGQILYE
jgi:hypothetical protein